MNKKNRPIYFTDPETNEKSVIWDSRSVAVGLYCFARTINGNWYILANKRGPGCPDFVGYWCCPCGYLDWNENEKEAAIRETFEECGITIDIDNVKVYDASADPSLNKENVTFRLYTVLPHTVEYYNSIMNSNNSEENEVDTIRFIPIEKLHTYNWAFSHDNNINTIFKNRININIFKRFILNLYNKYLYDNK